MTNFFNPPLYLQRYQFVIEFIKRNKPKKMVDLGCNDCALLRKVKFHREIELLAGVDIDSAVIREKMYALAPIPTDYLQPGDHPLTIELYQGSVTEKDRRIKGFDLVTSIELIEHLQLGDLDRFSEVVFGFMVPAAVIISTPNAEFNPLLPGLTGFRHYDHKFEWTRAEFQRWALRVGREFGYEVEFTGVGEAPGQDQTVGFCSQIGVFWRIIPVSQSHEPEGPLLYKLLYSVKYPSLCDNNVLQRILVNEVLYWSENLKRRWLEETSEREEDAYSDQNTEEEEEDMEGRLAERLSQMEGKEQDVERQPADWRRRREENEEMEDDDLTEGERLYRSGRSVCVPVARLWSCPRVESLSGNISFLKQILLNDSRVSMTEDGLAVVLAEAEDHQDLDYSDAPECTDIRQSVVCTVEEDWGA
ncbi:small RNA 2'-O-methyltransferase isoform X1 [Osmerus eperlanus]|uniref:small RNA 2'-O-methyltransferase isoform X1 n=2 Tax=Osmerus eperlanus TaxID=29151 RepID=UPI002E160D5A